MTHLGYYVQREYYDGNVLKSETLISTMDSQEAIAVFQQADTETRDEFTVIRLNSVQDASA